MSTALPIRPQDEGRDNDEGVRALMAWGRTNREAGWVLHKPRSGLGTAQTAKRAGECLKPRSGLGVDLRTVCNYRVAGWVL